VLNVLRGTWHRSPDNLPQRFIAVQILLPLLLFILHFLYLDYSLRNGEQVFAQLSNLKSTAFAPLTSSKLFEFMNSRKRKDLLDLVLHSGESYRYIAIIPKLETSLTFFFLK